jgi:RNase P/RNase MRP subunit p30
VSARVGAVKGVYIEIVYARFVGDIVERRALTKGNAHHLACIELSPAWILMKENGAIAARNRS